MSARRKPHRTLLPLLLLALLQRTSGRLEQTSLSKCLSGCSNRGKCLWWPTEPYFPAICLCETHWHGQDCSKRQINPYNNYAPESDKHNSWNKAAGVSCGDERFAKTCSECTGSTGLAKLCGGECSWTLGRCMGRLRYSPFHLDGQFPPPKKLPKPRPGQRGRGRGEDGRGRAGGRGDAAFAHRKGGGRGLGGRGRGRGAFADGASRTLAGEEATGNTPAITAAHSMVEPSVSSVDGARRAGGGRHGRLLTRVRGGGGALNAARAKDSSCSQLRGVQLLSVGGDGGALVELASALNRLSGESVPTPMHASSVQDAASSWPSLLEASGPMRAYVFVPHVSLLTAAAVARGMNGTSDSSDLARLANILRGLRGPQLKILTTPLTVQSTAVDSDDDGSARRGIAIPQWALRATRVAARVGGAIWLDTSTALLSARRNSAGGTSHLLATILSSAIFTHCGMPKQPAAAPLLRPLPRKERCAVCFSGWVGVAAANGGALLVENLIKPLQAETLLALTHHPSDNCDSIRSCRVAERFPALLPYAAATIAPMLPMRRLIELMEALPHWPAITRAYSQRGSRVNCVPALNLTGALPGTIGGPSSYTCHGIYLGNTIFAPVLGSAKLHVLRQLHDIRRCLGLLGEHETAVGAAYDRVVHTRLEYIWLRPHPPLALLSPQAVWVPSGEDYYGGVNDRHAVLSRAAAEVYMRRWDMITDGTIMRIDSQLRVGKVTNGLALQDENLVGALLRYFHLPLRRFPGVAYLGCCNHSVDSEATTSTRQRGLKRRCFSKACVVRKLPTDAAAAATCSAADGSYAGALPWTGGVNATGGASGVAMVRAAREAVTSGVIQLGKYRSEVEIAVQHALALGLPGAEYRLFGGGIEAQVGSKVANACTLPPRQKGVRLQATATLNEPNPSQCVQVGISVPVHRAAAFRALLALLKKRAFRLESQHVRWRAEAK
jgi:hypothetical protein